MQVVRISEPNPQLAMEIRELFAAERLEAPVPGPFELFALFDSNGRIEGAASVEVAEDICILRALAIRPGSRKKGLGYALVSHILFHCSGAHERMYLAARGQQVYFERFGFRIASRAEAPAAVARAILFSGCGPAGGPVMVIDLPQNAGGIVRNWL